MTIEILVMSRPLNIPQFLQALEVLRAEVVGVAGLHLGGRAAATRLGGDGGSGRPDGQGSGADTCLCPGPHPAQTHHRVWSQGGQEL